MLPRFVWALATMVLTACTPLTVVSPSATLSASPTTRSSPSPTISPPPTAAPTPLVDCREVPDPDCRVLVKSASQHGMGSVQRLSVERFASACMRAGLCAGPFGGFEASHLVTGELEAGGRRGWLCKLEAREATCWTAPREEVEPLATIVVRVVGTPRQEILLQDDGQTTWGWSATEVPTEHALMVGRWRLTTISRPCDGCDRIFPPTTEGWPLAERCTAPFEAKPAGHIEVTVHIEAGALCRIEVTSD